MKRTLLEQFVGQDVGDCHLEQLLGYGPLGAVYQAHQRLPKRPVMVTLLVYSDGLSTQARQQFRARFLRTAPRLSAVRHPHLLPLEAYGEWEEYPYLVTPAQPTRSLATILRQQGCCTPPTALTMLEQITAGLEHAHCQGLVHGTLSLSHLLVSNGLQIQTAGLGWQSLLERRGILPVAAPREQVLTLTGTWLVAQRYLAPECLHEGQTADIRSDVYSLGVILAELLTGRSPGSGTSAPEPAIEAGQHLLPVRLTQDIHLPPSLERVLHQALAQEPDRRFQRVSDLLAAFAEGLEEGTPAATNCWFCPLHPAVGITEPEGRHRMQEDKLLDATPFPWEMPPIPPSVEAPSFFSSAQSVQQHSKRFPARYRMWVRRGRLHSHRSHRISRRRLLGLLVKGGAVGVLGASVVGTGYLLTTTLLKPPVPQRSSRSHPQQALNTAQVFTVPRNGRQGLLVRLPNGTYVAYERSCTHVGVYVNYDSKTHLLVCPAHGAIFDPAHGGRVLQGPATRPLPQVPLHRGSDGTILI